MSSNTRTQSDTLTPSRSPSVQSSVSATPTQTATETPSTTATIFTIQIPAQQNSNADTIIRGYVSSYAASAGYSNAIVQSITWTNGVYTVIGSVVNPGQFSSSFPLSVGYTNLLANLNPMTPTPTATAPSIALPIGLAVGGTVVVAVAIGGMLYIVRQRRRKVVQAPIPETKMFVPTPASVAPMPTDLYADTMTMMNNEAHPPYPPPPFETSPVTFAPQRINRFKMNQYPTSFREATPEPGTSTRLQLAPSARNLQQTITKHPFQKRTSFVPE